MICLLLGRCLPASQDEGRDESSQFQSNKPFDILRFSDKPRKKHVNAIAQAGISRLCIQFSQNEDYSTGQGNQQVDQSNQTSSSDTDNILQMVCQPNWKNDIHDSGNWGGFITYPTFAEGFSTQLTST